MDDISPYFGIYGYKIIALNHFIKNKKIMVKYDHK